VPNDKQTTVESVGLKTGGTIQVKDLGENRTQSTTNSSCILMAF
jgi:hypothetical protein